MNPEKYTLACAVSVFCALTASCSTVYTPNEVTWRGFETGVNGRWRLSYELPLHASGEFSPEPRNVVNTLQDRGVLLAGIAFPGGTFDRVSFSSMYRIGVSQWPGLPVAALPIAEFERVNSERQRREREIGEAKGAVFSFETGPPTRMVANGVEWSCVDARDRTGGIAVIECKTPLREGLIVDAAVSFNKGLSTNSPAYLTARRMLAEIAERFRVLENDLTKKS